MQTQLESLQRLFHPTPGESPGPDMLFTRHSPSLWQFRLIARNCPFPKKIHLDSHFPQNDTTVPQVGRHPVHTDNLLCDRGQIDYSGL